MTSPVPRARSAALTRPAFRRDVGELLLDRECEPSVQTGELVSLVAVDRLYLPTFLKLTPKSPRGIQLGWGPLGGDQG